MGQTVSFDYFYGGQSDTFSYYRIPRLLITGQQFKGLSTDAKLLYGLMLDRMGLSARNGWYDELGRVYIYYPLDEVQADLNCGHDKATKLLSELDTGKGIGLIERVKQGQGRPAKIYNRLGKNACTSHKIEARDLYNLVLKDIQELAKTALKDADAFYQRLSSRMERRYLLDASQTQKECQRLESRNREIDEMFLSLYTDKAKGILTEQRFMKLTATLEQEQEANQKRLQDLLLMMRHSDEQENEVRTFIKEIRRYAAIEELDEAVLNRLISKILVGEVKKIDGQKVQEVRIVYNFVGEIPEITA